MVVPFAQFSSRSAFYKVANYTQTERGLPLTTVVTASKNNFKYPSTVKTTRQLNILAPCKNKHPSGANRSGFAVSTRTRNGHNGLITTTVIKAVLQSTNNDLYIVTTENWNERTEQQVRFGDSAVAKTMVTLYFAVVVPRFVVCLIAIWRFLLFCYSDICVALLLRVLLRFCRNKIVGKKAKFYC